MNGDNSVMGPLDSRLDRGGLRDRRLNRDGFYSRTISKLYLKLLPLLRVWVRKRLQNPKKCLVSVHTQPNLANLVHYCECVRIYLLIRTNLLYDKRKLTHLTTKIHPKAIPKESCLEITFFREVVKKFACWAGVIEFNPKQFKIFENDTRPTQIPIVQQQFTI